LEVPCVATLASPSVRKRTDARGRGEQDWGAKSTKERNAMDSQNSPSIGNEARSAVVRNVDQATVGVHDTINAVSDATRPAVDRMATGAHVVVDRVAGVAMHAAETIGSKGEQLKSAQQRLVGGTRGYMQENPLALLGIVFVAGFVASRLMSSR
jgi:hypothetical protein